ncbi:MAG TPA: hemolysin III family protein [Smithella sp.]|jgi:hemolysin III|nr:hemolysin III family protein [Smithella sp.]OQC54120.1 MAG: hemolysin-III related [Deltaproteobacteria bacterium ADurb.Bin022]HNQ65814.1 hemolysin III family protein [Smithella sp.]HOG10554.1 hemolysin III family protein [Smithella sp.]HOO34993.1 hemolysin III family protein [Smithella sp.]
MTETQTAENYTPLEEIFNSLTHGIGILISLAGMVLMIVFASRYGNVNHIVSCTIFGLTLVMLYTASTLYHSFRKPTLKHVFKICDHSCIYLLIAGTYTPFLMVTLKGMLGWSLFAVVWTLTAAGILFKIFFVYRFNILSTIAYILMGWIIIFAVKPLLHSLPEGGIAFLVAGGLAYTLGTIFYAWKKLPFNHAIWHLFVLGGSICHFLAVILYVIPGPSI